MSRGPRLRGALWIAVMGSALQTGCIHNHYYGTSTSIPGCPPVGSTVTTQLGSVCDVPTGQVIVSNPSSRVISSNVITESRPAPVMIDANTGASRVVISQPAYGPPSIGQATSRFKWRKLDPENLPTMRAEGGFDDSVLR